MAEDSQDGLAGPWSKSGQYGRWGPLDRRGRASEGANWEGVGLLGVAQ